MKVYAVDIFARPGDRDPTRTLQVPAASADEAVQKSRKSMSDGETEARPNTSQQPKPVQRLLDIKV